MTTKSSESYSIVLDGEKRTCRLTIGAFRFAQMAHGSDIDPSDFQSGRLKMGKLASLVWVSLLHEDADLTEREVVEKMMRSTPEEEEQIMFVMGKAVAHIGEAGLSFGNGIEAAEKSEKLTEAVQQAAKGSDS